MKQAAAIGGGLVVVALGAVGLGFMLMSGGGEAEQPAPTSPEPTEQVAGSVEAPSDDVVADAVPDEPPRARPNRTGRTLKVTNNAKTEFEEGDPKAPLNDAEKWKERRKERNEKWRTDQMALANSWVNSNALADDQGQELLDTLNRAHDILKDTRADIEAGVISPKVGREEMDFAKEEVGIEVKRVLGDELGQDFLDEIAKAAGGGF